MRTPIERFFHSTDGTRIFYRYWPPLREADTAGQGILLLHRGHEHSGRVQHIVDELDLPGFAMFAWDARGHGRSRGRPEGNPTFSVFVKDLDQFARHVSTFHGIAIHNLAVIAQSVGAVLAATWAHDYAPGIRCMVLATPAFKVKLYVPFARIALRIGSRINANLCINSWVRPAALTHDPERIASYKSDSLIQRPISARVLLGLYNTADRVIADARAIRTPTQLLISDSDFVVHKKPQHEFFENLGASVREKQVFEGFYHDTLGEKNRHLAIAKARRFLVASFADPPVQTSLADAHLCGSTKEECDALSRPLPLLSLKRLAFAIARFGIRTGGRLSDGLRIGLRTGFDSGSSLDYVYRNNPSGITPAGKLIDWFYLNSIGWRGIRVRRHNLERLLLRSMNELRDVGKPVRILDVAAGHGRYVIEALQKAGQGSAEAILRDYSTLNVHDGRNLIRSNALDAQARFEQGDAFDARQIAAIRPRPTIGVVSGFYELFPDNDLVRQSLAGLADALGPGGLLIYTNQPWHPQLEMIARVLSSHRDHKPWVMRCRTQEEMDQLVEQAGFQKVDQLIDEWGIFTVSVARRLAVCRESMPAGEEISAGHGRA